MYRNEEKRHEKYGWTMRSDMIDLSKRYYDIDGVKSKEVLKGLKFRLKTLTNNTDWMHREENTHDGFVMTLHVKKGSIKESVAREFGFM